MRKYLWQAISLSLLLLLGVNANAQTSISVPSDSKFVLQVDLQALKSSKVGAVLFEMAKKAAMDEVGKKVDAKDVSADKIQEVLGMDPFEEIQGIVISASDYESPEKSLLGMVRLKKTTGNIEGLLLSFASDTKNPNIATTRFIQLPRTRERRSSEPFMQARLETRHLLLEPTNPRSQGSWMAWTRKALRTSRSSRLNCPPIAKSLHKCRSWNCRREKMGKGPQANIAAMLTSLVISLSEEEQELELRAAMQAGTEKKAEQIRQSIQGLGAMVELFASMDEQDDDVKNVLKFIKKVKVVQEETSVSVKVRVPSAEIAEMIKKEMNDN